MIFFIVMLLLLFQACAEDEGAAIETCGVVNVTQVCLCIDGSQGIQSCLDTGGWSVCQCGENPDLGSGDMWGGDDAAGDMGQADLHSDLSAVDRFGEIGRAHV